METADVPRAERGSRRTRFAYRHLFSRSGCTDHAGNRPGHGDDGRYRRRLALVLRHSAGRQALGKLVVSVNSFEDTTTIWEAATALDMPLGLVYALCEVGRLAYVRPGRGIRVLRTAVELLESALTGRQTETARGREDAGGSVPAMRIFRRTLRPK